MDKAKKIVAGLALGTILVSGITFLPDGSVRICETTGYCEEISALEFQNAAFQVLLDYRKAEQLSWSEYQFLIMVYDRVAKNCKISVQNPQIENEDVFASQILDSITMAVLRKCL